MEQYVRKQINEHFADLSNEQLLSQIRIPKTVRILEETLGDSILPELKCMKERNLDLGQKLSHKDIETYFPGIKQSIDTLLDVDGPSPNIWIQTFTDRNYIQYLAGTVILGGGIMGYLGASLCTLDFTPTLEVLALGETIGIGLRALTVLFGSPNFYDPNRENISLRPNNVACARGVMAHEYVHRVQDMEGIPFGGKFTYVSEGMAEGVKNEVGKHSETSDDSVRYENLQSHFHNMQGAYRLLAKQLGIKIKKELIQPEHPWVQSFERMYAYGTAFFHIQEMKHGLGFYKNLISRAKQQLGAITKD